MAVFTMSYNKTQLSGTNADRTAMTTSQLGSVQYEFFESDTKITYKWTGAEWRQTGTNSADHTREQGQIGGERNVGSLTNNYDATKHECNSTILNTQITAQAISAGAPAFLMGIHIHTALTGTLTITGLTNLALTATDWVIPIGATGSVLPGGNARRCETALIATLSSATDYGRVMIDWRPI